MQKITQLICLTAILVLVATTCMARTVKRQAKTDDLLNGLIKRRLKDDDCFNATITLHVYACDTYSAGSDCANGTLIHRLEGCGLLDPNDLLGTALDTACASRGK
jgi:hypothetical protein